MFHFQSHVLKSRAIARSPVAHSNISSISSTSIGMIRSSPQHGKAEQHEVARYRAATQPEPCKHCKPAGCRLWISLPFACDLGVQLARLAKVGVYEEFQKTVRSGALECILSSRSLTDLHGGQERRIEESAPGWQIEHSNSCRVLSEFPLHVLQMTMESKKRKGIGCGSSSHDPCVCLRDCRKKEKEFAWMDCVLLIV